MTMPLMPSKRKNPVLRTRQMNLPPWARSRVALGLTVAAAEAAVGLAIVIGLFRHRESLNPDAFASLKW